jgi:hypothetical protein
MITPPIVDMTAVRAALRGNPVFLTDVEKHVAVHEGYPSLSLNQLALRLHMSLGRTRTLRYTPLPADLDVSDPDAFVPLPEDCEVAA